jgi:hypothetical protein
MNKMNKKWRWNPDKCMPEDIYYGDNIRLSRVLYYLGMSVSYLMSFIALPLRVIPEDWCYSDDGHLKRTNWVTSLFWWEWLHDIEMWAFEQSLRNDPTEQVWNENDIRYDYYNMLIEIDVVHEGDKP